MLSQSAFVGLLLMSGSALVQLMRLTAVHLDLQGFPLSHDEVARAPGCSWGEYLQCSDEDFQDELRRTVGVKAAALAKA